MWQEQVLHEKQKAKKRHKNISWEHFSFTNSSGNFARKQTPTDMSRYLVTKNSHLHVRTGLRKQKIGDTEFSLFCKRLKEQCHEDFAVLGQFCAKIVNLRL